MSSSKLSKRAREILTAAAGGSDYDEGQISFICQRGADSVSYACDAGGSILGGPEFEEGASLGHRMYTEYLEGARELAGKRLVRRVVRQTRFVEHAFELTYLGYQKADELSMPDDLMAESIKN